MSLVLISMFLFAGCGANVTGVTMEIPANLVKGESATATLTAAYDKPDASAEEKAKALEELTITYASSDEKVATVDANGTIKAVGGGFGHTQSNCSVRQAGIAKQQAAKAAAAKQASGGKTGTQNAATGGTAVVTSDAGTPAPAPAPAAVWRVAINS